MKKKIELRQLDEFSRQLLEQAGKHGRAVVWHAGSLLRIPNRLLWAFITEGQETKDMMLTFLRQGKRIVIKNGSGEGPTEEEIKAALEQLKDIPRMLPFLVVTVVPAPGITEGYVLLVLTVEKWLGQKIRLLPSSFRRLFHKNSEQDEIEKKNTVAPTNGDSESTAKSRS